MDRFDTGLVDLSGNGGLFAQVNGRTSKVLIEWLQAQDPDWLLAVAEDDDEGVVLVGDGFRGVRRHGEGVVGELTNSRVDECGGGRHGDGSLRAAWDAAGRAIRSCVVFGRA